MKVPAIVFGILLASSAAIGCSDTTAPVLPNPPEHVTTTLAAKNKITIAWDARPGAEHIAAYSVYRDGVLLGETAATSFSDSTAPQLITHAYAVASRSSAGVISELSASVSIFAPDATAPHVLSSTPADQAINVAPTTTAQVKFSEPIDSASLNAASFIVKDAVAGTTLPGAVSFVAATRTAVWTPSAPLPAEKRVSVSVTTAVKDTAGNSLAASYSYSFTVRENTPPVVIDYSPQNGATIPMGTFPTVRFSERMGDFTGVRMIDSTSQSVLTTALLYDTLTNVVTVRNVSRVKSFRPYTISVDERALDLAGHPTTSLLKFTVRFGEWQLPEPIARFPDSTAVNVPTNAVITVDFGSPILPVNDYELHMSIRPTASTTPLPSIGIIPSIGTHVTLTPIGMQPSTEYIVALSQFFTDSKGVRQQMDRVWTFRTGN